MIRTFNRPLGPFAILYEPRNAPNSTTPKRYKKHPAVASRAYDSAAAMCESKEERDKLRKKYIRDWEKAQIMRVNKTSDLGAHGGLSKGQRAPR